MKHRPILAGLAVLGLTGLAPALLAPAVAVAADPAEKKVERAAEKAESKVERATDKAKEKGQETKGALSDSWLTAKTKIALAADERVKARQIDVDTKGGTVTLRGKVDSAEAKTAAEAIAKSVEGVKGVKNTLQVVAPSQQAAVEANDKDIARTVKDRISKDARLQKADIGIATDAGVVTLKGDVPSLSASARASEVARGVPGVRAVRNELAVKDK
jgi:hyperosmotically inducible periplasmic protein